MRLLRVCADRRAGICRNIKINPFSRSPFLCPMLKFGACYGLACAPGLSTASLSQRPGIGGESLAGPPRAGWCCLRDGLACLPALHPPPQAQARGPLGRGRWDSGADTKRHNLDPTSAETDKHVSRFRLRITGGGRRRKDCRVGPGLEGQC